MKVAPKKELGQHFLVDVNVLGVIGRLAELGPDDVVLEIGPGSACSRATSPSESHACTRSSSTGRSSRTCATRRERRRSTSAMRFARSRVARARRVEARREPAVQRRHTVDRREPRRPAAGEALVRDGAARGRGQDCSHPPGRRHTAPSRCSCSSSARAPASTPSPERCSGRGRTSTPRWWRSAVLRCRTSSGA